jgi:hypothetical protein
MAPASGRHRTADDRQSRIVSGSAGVPPAPPATPPAGGGPAHTSSPSRGSVPVRKERGPTLSAVVGSVMAVIGLAVGLGGLDDNSFLTHLATGRLIWDTHHIPRTDPYTFSAHGTPWVVQSWLASVFYAGLERLGGGAAILIGVGLSSAALAALVWTLTSPAQTLLGRVLLTGLVIAVGVESWVERPLLFGLIALALLMLAADGRLHPAWLVPVMWIWVNTHGSWPLGLLAVALWAMGRRLDGQSPAVEVRALRWAAGSAVLGGLNPLGPRLLLFPVELLSRRDVLGDVVEWKAPTFDTGSQLAFLGMIGLAVVLLARRPCWRTALPLAVFVPAALLGQRNVVVASVVLVPGLAQGIAGLGSVTGTERRQPFRVGMVAVAAVAVLLVSSTASGRVYRLGPYPVAAVTWLQDQGMLGSSSRVVAPDFVGNYLEARFGTTVPVWIDDRYDMVPEDVARDNAKLVFVNRGWDEVLGRRGTTAVLWASNEPLGTLLLGSPQWRIVYSDSHWLVAIPR